jgi:cytochrome c5
VGKKVFGSTCSLCHASGAAGAPIFGNKADWDPRIAQGMDVLYKHAIEGFTGAKGVMPARGGSTTLSDDDVKAAVNYMVDKVKNG